MELDDFPKGLRMAAWDLCAAVPGVQPMDFDVLLSVIEQTDKADWRGDGTPEALYSPDGIQARVALRTRLSDDDAGTLMQIPAIKESLKRLGRGGILKRSGKTDFIDVSAVKEAM